MAEQDDSPTGAIHAYLASKGLQATGENVRRVLEQNASNPGLIAGLTNQAPPAAERSASNPPTQRSGGAVVREPAMPAVNANGGQQTSATPPTVNTTPPPEAPGMMAGLSPQLAQLLGIGAAGAAGAGVMALAGRNRAAPAVEAPAATTTPTVEAEPLPEFKDGLMNSRARGQQRFREMAGITAQGPTSSTAMGPDPAYVTGVDPMKSAMDKAVPQQRVATPTTDISIPPTPSVAEGIGIPRPPPPMPIPDGSDMSEVFKFARTNPEAAGKLLNELNQSHAMSQLGKLRALRGLRVP